MDKHLNIFYSYNQDNELIENNLTRAFIVSIRFLSENAKGHFIKLLLGNYVSYIDSIINPVMPDYTKMKFSFQGHMNKKKTRSFKHSFILAIATEFYEKDENYIGFYENSIPDAWMYDDEKGLCFLIESKVGQNPLDKMQLNSHAHEWLGLDEQEEINKRILSIKWFDLLTAIEQLHVLYNKGELAMNQQELLIIQSLKEYLGFYGYKVFKGFNYNNLTEIPKFFFPFIKFGKVKSIHFPSLLSPPNFIIKG